ncbi:hypothetical protein GCM10010442_31280 [Kitasatospora kifunensis]
MAGSGSPAVAAAIYDARSKAKAAGKAVPIDAMTSEAATTVANPDGTLTTTQSAQAVRFKRGDSWADIDTTLHANADGTLSPAAVPVAVTLSGGGSGPMATITTSDGKQLATSAPFTLPAPSVSGDTATYASVLPDVDLQITATRAGGWRDVIVVRSTAAAANPALKTIHFPIATVGLTANADASGSLSFTDATGAVRLSSPTSFQWDSSSPSTSGASPSPSPVPRPRELPCAQPPSRRLTPVRPRPPPVRKLQALERTSR